jgi:dihydroorotate dehydrogenase
MNWREVATRAILTFVQAFLAVLLVDGVSGIDNVEDVQAPIVAGIAAVLSLIYNVVKQYQASKGWSE